MHSKRRDLTSAAAAGVSVALKLHYRPRSCARALEFGRDISCRADTMIEDVSSSQNTCTRSVYLADEDPRHGHVLRPAMGKLGGYG